MKTSINIFLLVTVFFTLASCNIKNKQEVTGDVLDGSAEKVYFDYSFDKNVEDLYAPIIEAYIKLEESMFKEFDEKIIGDSLLAVSGGYTYNFGWDKPPVLNYAFYDINKNGIYELLIGGDSLISGIYSLQNGIPVSIIQVEHAHNLRLSTDSNDNCVIGHSRGKMGTAIEFFYTINENGELVTLDKLYTNGDIKDESRLIGHYRAKEVDGQEVDISETEYCTLIKQYGDYGYEPFEDIGETRYIDIEWSPMN